MVRTVSPKSKLVPERKYTFFSFPLLLLERSQATTQDRGHLIFHPLPVAPNFFSPSLGFPTTFHHRHIFIPITLFAVFTGDSPRFTSISPTFQPPLRSRLFFLDIEHFWQPAAFLLFPIRTCPEYFPQVHALPRQQRTVNLFAQLSTFLLLCHRPTASAVVSAFASACRVSKLVLQEHTQLSAALLLGTHPPALSFQHPYLSETRNG